MGTIMSMGDKAVFKPAGQCAAGSRREAWQKPTMKLLPCDEAETGTMSSVDLTNTFS